MTTWRRCRREINMKNGKELLCAAAHNLIGFDISKLTNISYSTKPVFELLLSSPESPSDGGNSKNCFEAEQQQQQKRSSKRRCNIVFAWLAGCIWGHGQWPSLDRLARSLYLNSLSSAANAVLRNEKSNFGVCVKRQCISPSPRGDIGHSFISFSMCVRAFARVFSQLNSIVSIRSLHT